MTLMTAYETQLREALEKADAATREEYNRLREHFRGLVAKRNSYMDAHPEAQMIPFRFTHPEYLSLNRLAQFEEKRLGVPPPQLSLFESNKNA